MLKHISVFFMDHLYCIDSSQCADRLQFRDLFAAEFTKYQQQQASIGPLQQICQVTGRVRAELKRYVLNHKASIGLTHVGHVIAVGFGHASSVDQRFGECMVLGQTNAGAAKRFFHTLRGAQVTCCAVGDMNVALRRLYPLLVITGKQSRCGFTA